MNKIIKYMWLGVLVYMPNALAENVQIHVRANIRPTCRQNSVTMGNQQAEFKCSKGFQVVQHILIKDNREYLLIEL